MTFCKIGRKWGEVGHIPQAHEIQKCPHGHKQMMLVVGDQSALQQALDVATSLGNLGNVLRAQG